MGEAISEENFPATFSAFKPVGHVMVGLPDLTRLQALTTALREAGWAADGLHKFEPGAAVSELEAMVDAAGPLAGFGYEITLLRRYLALAREGCRWLLVKVDGTEQAAQVADIARQHGAVLAVHYRALVIEELI